MRTGLRSVVVTMAVENATPSMTFRAGGFRAASDTPTPRASQTHPNSSFVFKRSGKPSAKTPHYTYDNPEAKGRKSALGEVHYEPRSGHTATAQVGTGRTAGVAGTGSRRHMVPEATSADTRSAGPRKQIRFPMKPVKEEIPGEKTKSGKPKTVQRYMHPSTSEQSETPTGGVPRASQLGPHAPHHGYTFTKEKTPGVGFEGSGHTQGFGKNPVRDKGHVPATGLYQRAHPSELDTPPHHGGPTARVGQTGSTITYPKASPTLRERLRSKAFGEPVPTTPKDRNVPSEGAGVPVRKAETSTQKSPGTKVIKKGGSSGTDSPIKMGPAGPPVTKEMEDARGKRVGAKTVPVAGEAGRGPRPTHATIKVGKHQFRGVARQPLPPARASLDPYPRGEAVTSISHHPHAAAHERAEHFTNMAHAASTLADSMGTEEAHGHALDLHRKAMGFHQAVAKKSGGKVRLRGGRSTTGTASFGYHNERARQHAEEVGYHRGKIAELSTARQKREDQMRGEAAHKEQSARGAVAGQIASQGGELL